jgi:hypothetical protein
MYRLPLVLDRRSGGMPHFDIIHRIAQEARRYAQETKKAASLEAACPTLLPLLDELRTFCYENKIEEIPALLAV